MRDEGGGMKAEGDFRRQKSENHEDTKSTMVGMKAEHRG